MELRDIEIFLTLADELHFGRTAARLHLSAARISQSIKKQERNIGGTLFDRSTRAVRLTPLGRQLHDDLLPHYRGLHDSMAHARRAARGITDVLTVGMLPANAYDLRPFWDAFRARRPGCELRIRHSGFIEPFAALRDGEIDALVSWLPVEEPDLTVGPDLFTEPKVLVVAADHELAHRASVSAEVRGHYGGLTAGAGSPEYWEDAFSSFYTPRGRPVDKGIEVVSVEDILTAVSERDAVHNLGAHAARYLARPGIAFVGLDGESPLRWALIWRSDAENDTIRVLADVIRDLGPVV
ncbi:LysR family transcriptional regulator [Nocardia sp. NPDC005825]|uniref:LysR family transcriptional regulator n=1 Tax=unclassified Nocardia TaxID=2637762 RepID=UPI0033DB85BA